MAVKMKNALVGSVGLFAIAMAFALLAIPQVSYADQAVDESDALAAADEAGHGWVRDESDNWLYYDAQSNLYAGWLKYGGAWYWLNPETGVMAVGVVEIDGMGYHFAQSGALTYGWEFDNGSWYYSNGSGVLMSGWYSYNGGWYYFQEGTYAMYEGMIDFGGQLYWLKPSASGRMAVGWELIDGDWYHFNGSGCADSAWLEDGGDWYYFDPMTHVMATGWLQLGSDWYYLSDMRSRGWYVSPLLADENNTREERIEAMISTAYEYYGDTYKACYSQAPGGYVDCSGLAMQGLYAAGFDPWPVSPERHSNPAYEYESRNMWNLPIQRVSYSDRQRGDLIYYDNGYGTIIHVAIYLGDDKVIEAWPPSVTVMSTVNGIHPHVYGVQRPFA